MRLVSAASAATAAVLAISGLALAAPAGAASARSTATTLSSSAKPMVGGTVRLTAVVKPKPKGGTIRFSIAGRSIARCAKVKVNAKTGKAACTTKFAQAGTRKVKAAFSGKKPYRASARTKSIKVIKATGQIVGGVGACTTAKGALVAVDFAHWSGPIVRGCDPSPTTGAKLLTTAKFTTAGTQHDGPSFICRIGNPLFGNGTQYPTAAQDKCIVTPPASAYWSYWLALKGTNTWSYNTLGAYSDQPKASEVEAWTYGATNAGGTTGKPTFTPNQVRAGLPAAKVSHTAAVSRAAVSRAAMSRAAVSPAAKSANLARAVGYLTSSANLVGGTHYEPFGGGFADYGLTMDGALALAATGTDDTALRKIVSSLDHAGKDGSGRAVDDYTGIGTQYASGGSIAKEALVAEVAGYDPRAFGGHNLITALDGLVCTASNSGSCAGAGNYSYAQSTFSQALGVIAQLRAGDTTNAAKPVQFLEGLQGSNGAFPSVIPGSNSDVDSTAMAAMALALRDRDSTATAAVTKAVDWIASKQLGDGGFPGAAGDSTNSAALAIQGLTLAGSKYRTQIDHAAAFLGGQQNTDGGFSVGVGTPGSDLRASAQVVGGLAGTPFGTLSDNVTMAAATSDPAAGARYLVKQLVDGDHLEFAGGFGPNYGGTADIAFALASAGGQDATLRKIVTYLIKHVDDYVDPNGTQDFPGPFTGSAAKLAVLAEVTGQDPTDFGGLDLISLLEHHVCAGADTAGTCTAKGDFYQVFSTTGQALGVLAIARDGQTPPAEAVARLEQLQCTDGGFQSLLTAPGATCSEVDTTGFAVQSLTLVPSAEASVTRAVAYLRGQQERDGGWPGAAGDNTNSAALAIQGLLAAPTTADVGAVRANATGSDPQVKAGVRFLAARQNGDGGFGISAASAGSDEPATAQAVPAIGFDTLTTLSHPISLTAPSSPTAGSGTTSSGGGSSAPASSSPSSTSTTSGAGNLADTGAHSSNLVGLALMLLLGGLALTVAGRQRRLSGRHRN